MNLLSWSMNSAELMNKYIHGKMQFVWLAATEAFYHMEVITANEPGLQKLDMGTEDICILLLLL